MKMIKSTSITSTRGVTFMSALVPTVYFLPTPPPASLDAMPHSQGVRLAGGRR